MLLLSAWLIWLMHILHRFSSLQMGWQSSSTILGSWLTSMIMVRRENTMLICLWYPGPGDAEEALSAPQNKHVRIENKNFYFDIKRNQQGRYMSISEVKGNFRNSILVPESGWESFRDVLDDYVKQVLLTGITRKYQCKIPWRLKHSFLVNWDIFRGGAGGNDKYNSFFYPSPRCSLWEFPPDFYFFLWRLPLPIQ